MYTRIAGAHTFPSVSVNHDWRKRQSNHFRIYSGIRKPVRMATAPKVSVRQFLNAAGEGRTADVAAALETGACTILAEDGSRVTALHRAAAGGHLTTVHVWQSLQPLFFPNPTSPPPSLP